MTVEFNTKNTIILRVTNINGALHSILYFSQMTEMEEMEE